MKSVFEVEREGASVVVWEAGIGSRVIFPSEVFAIAQTDRLQTDEQQFHAAKSETGVYVIYAYGESVTPFEYIRRCMKAWRSKVGQHLGIQVYENVLEREQKDYW